MPLAQQAYQVAGILPKMSQKPINLLRLLNRRTAGRLAPLAAQLTMFAALGLASAAHATCDDFIRWSAETLDTYQAEHRIYPLPADLQTLATQHMPNLWVHPNSYRPIDFDAYLSQASLYQSPGNRVIAQADTTRSAIRALSREEQCATHLKSPEQPDADIAPVYVQAYTDHGPDAEPNWLYLKYTWVFDWSGLAEQRGWLSRVGAVLTGGKASRWHRLDVHTSATLGLDATRQVRTLSLQQHNNKRTHVAGIDFPHNEPLHLAAAYNTNELYLDTGASDPQVRRAVATFLQWAHLIDEQQNTLMWQRDEFIGRNAGGEPVKQQPVFIEPNHPLAAYAGHLAPKRRILGMYVGRDGPPGYDFDGVSDLPEATVIGFWREHDTAFLPVLAEHLHGFSDTNWTAIANYLRPRLIEALAAGQAKARPNTPLQ